MPETRTVRRLQHSAKAIISELPQQSPYQCDQSSTQSCGDGVFSDERSSMKMKLVNIWNCKLQTQGECRERTSTHDVESKEEFAPAKTQKFSDSVRKWRDFRPEVTIEYLSHISDVFVVSILLRTRILYSISLLASCILLVIHWFLIPLIKTAWRVPKFSNRLIRW